MSTIEYTFPGRFAGIDLEIVTWTEDIGRDVVQHRASRGDGAQLSDRGRVPRTYSITAQVTGTPAEVAGKRAAMVAIASDGTTRVFEHPLEGIVRCKLAEYQGAVGAGDVSFAMTLIEDLAFTRRFPNRPIVAQASLQDVRITGETLEAALEGLALSIPPPDVQGALAKAATWTERAQGDVVADVEAARIDARPLRRELDASSAVDHYQASIALEAWRGTYERYAARVNDIRGATFELRVGRPQPLIVLLSSLYGAETAEVLNDEVARINDIRDTARLPTGTLLALPERAK